MATAQPLRASIVFGPFELNVSGGELRKSGIRIRLPDQPFRILVLLVSRPGEIVTREELREQIWSDGTFVDFEHGLYAAMNRLRRALGDSAENARYIETIPGKGYRFIGNLARAEPPAVIPIRRSSSLLPWAAGLLGCAVSAVLGWYMHKPAPAPQWTVTRVTNDAGLSSSPAISRDGKLIAYSSEGESGGTDLYVKQLSGGAAVRLTSNGAGNTQPDFSPDGGTVVFRSSRGGGGIYTIPTFGGDARFLARDGRNPKFSPDGKRVAFWIGDLAVALAVPGSGTIWTVSVSGGTPERAGASLASARFPLWSPDGRRLLVTGYASAKAYESSAVDWWLVEGARVTRTGAYAVFERAGLRGNSRSFESAPDSGSQTSIPAVPRPSCWSGTDNGVTFCARTARADTFSIWRARVSPATGEFNGELSRLTTGPGNEMEASCASTRAVVFTSPDLRANVWSLPADLNAGAVRGPLTRITDGPAWRESPSLAGDGGQIAFASSQTGTMTIWGRDLRSGSEGAIAVSTFPERFPVISGSGDRVAFSSYEKRGRSVSVLTRGGTADKVCDGCLRATDWSRDEQRLLVFGGNPYAISVLEIPSRRQSVLLRHASHPLLFARYSPDERWLSFTERTGANRARLWIAPVGGTKPVPESAWIPIAEGGVNDWSAWSPDGRTMYFTSARDGHTCIWGQRLDVRTHWPAGPAFALEHLHGRISYRGGGWSLGGGRLAIALEEESGNIWAMSSSR